MSCVSGINDFVVKFATVNGSGSASANLMFAKTLFRMGIPVSPKNIFPSNIQGLPTWYEVRVSGDGYLARRDGIDLMVAMNAQTYENDLKQVVSGGYLLYDSTLPRKFTRPDVTIIDMPISKMCAEHWADTRQRQLFKNMVYVGAVAALIDIDLGVLEGVVASQFKGKDKLIEPNLKALHMGRDYIQANYACPLPIKVTPGNATDGKILVSGNEAAGLGAVYGGASVCAWYPITPSTSLAESYERHAKALRMQEDGKKLFGMVQAEDELAAIGIAIGAGWNGARSFTATSGPGVSLMNEFLGLAYYAEVPLVLFNVQRGGPSTGMPTRTQQSDVLSCAYASHGDTRHVLLFPTDPTECFTFAAQAFDLAERLQTPVIVMSDLDIGMNDWVCDELDWDDAHVHDRGKVLSAEELDAMPDWGRYKDIDGDGITYRTIPGTHPTKGAFFTRGTSHDESARYTEDGVVNAQVMDRLLTKFQTAASILPKPVSDIRDESSRIGIIYFGANRPAVMEAMDRLRDAGVVANALRITAFPFAEEVRAFADDHDRIYVVEQNQGGQMRQLLMVEADIQRAKLISILNYDGMPMTAEFIRARIGAAESHAKIAAE
ncbi:MAG: 2-oxoacid:acceptor oxidoreductase subunit alpha [Alphaproteobacteria bacterium]|nr:2-oxoacid:acceptor oxidoreductase subunit alpha [Alphaproteobacteria bacterium]